jgi:hypothetical protein
MVLECGVHHLQFYHFRESVLHREPLPLKAEGVTFHTFKTENSIKFNFFRLCLQTSKICNINNELLSLKIRQHSGWDEFVLGD